jgi:hypothetical protein
MRNILSLRISVSNVMGAGRFAPKMQLMLPDEWEWYGSNSMKNK